MNSAPVHYFTCPICSVQTELLLTPPIYIGCSKCCSIFSINQEQLISPRELKVKNLDVIKTVALGATGKYMELTFQIIGHIRSIGTNSISNEWLMLFENNEIKWLVEDVYSYFIFENESYTISNQTIKNKKVGSKFSMNNAEYIITGLSKQIEFQMKGQIPEACVAVDSYFIYEALAIDSQSFVSINVYSKELIVGFRGVSVDLTTLNLSCLTEFKDWM